MEHLEEKNEKYISLTFQEAWLQEEPSFLEEYTEELNLKVLEDLGECEEYVENEEGILELTKVHKFKVEEL